MKELIHTIVKSLVTNEDDVLIEESQDEGVININIKVNDADKGKIVGRKGSIITSIRNIAKAKAIKEKVKVNISI